ncbi:ion transporter [Amycolatopsis sp. OK19-0408]|uniref:Ion transporter n=1 Tax=Amycolatopsis iheyensis TaxID=2945988 RepID=A0A9X2N592_9PSEU|nr:ion transporter [Amycolatopsis iheyensis]MCR6481542.1 ion transporter [Amycolatopsis iheyensis]
MATLRDAREPELNSGILPGNVRADDWIMLLLAAGSVGLLGFMVLSPPARDVGLVIFYVDCGICGVFLLEFLWRWRKRRWARKFLVRNWYELFAMIPVAHPAMAAHKFVSVVLLLVRIGRAADRAVGEQFTYRLVDKLSEPIVKAIKKPVTIAVLDEVVKVLETGNYPENLAKSLGANKEELRTIIAEKIAEDPQLGKLKRLPFHDEIVRTVVDTSFRVLLEVLLDPRIDDFFSTVVRDNREQIRLAVQLGLNEVDDEDKEKSLRVRTQHSAALEYDRLHPPSRP